MPTFDPLLVVGIASAVIVGVGVILSLSNTPFNVTSRYRWLRFLSKISIGFQKFWAETDSIKLRVRDRRLLYADVAVVCLGVTPVIPILVAEPAYFFLGVLALGLILIWGAGYACLRFISRSKELGAVFMSKTDEGVQSSKAIAKTRRAYWFIDRQFALLTFLAEFTVIGTFLALSRQPSDSTEILFGIIVVAILLEGYPFAIWQAIDVQVEAEDRLYRTFFELRKADPILLEVYYGPGGVQFGGAQLISVGKTCVIQDANQRRLELEWRKVEAIALSSKDDEDPKAYEIKPDSTKEVAATKSQESPARAPDKD